MSDKTHTGVPLFAQAAKETAKPVFCSAGVDEQNVPDCACSKKMILHVLHNKW